MWLHVRWNHYRNTMLLKTFKHIKIQRAINLDALAYWAHAVQQFAYKPQTRTCAHFPKECSNNSTKSKPFSDGDKVSRHDEQSKPQYSAVNTCTNEQPLKLHTECIRQNGHQQLSQLKDQILNLRWKLFFTFHELINSITYQKFFCNELFLST